MAPWFGALSPSPQERIGDVPIEELERLGASLLAWQPPGDLPNWLRPMETAPPSRSCSNFIAFAQ
ncbi:MAG: DUF4351 domain-containing protein [Pseudanabaenaceae cyanobacterium]